jgi:hypothetical protein
MRIQVSYEWTVNQLDGEDIVDINGFDTLKEALSYQQRLQAPSEIELVRSEGNDACGVTDRLWATLEHGKLPEYLASAYGACVLRIPKRFHAEAQCAETP